MEKNGGGGREWWLGLKKKDGRKTPRSATKQRN
jgi:hypothetical protein